MDCNATVLTTTGTRFSSTELEPIFSPGLKSSLHLRKTVLRTIFSSFSSCGRSLAKQLKLSNIAPIRLNTTCDLAISFADFIDIWKDCFQEVAEKVGNK